jgi:hypothetical protein
MFGLLAGLPFLSKLVPKAAAVAVLDASYQLQALQLPSYGSYRDMVMYLHPNTRAPLAAMTEALKEPASWDYEPFEPFSDPHLPASRLPE